MIYTQRKFLFLEMFYETVFPFNNSVNTIKKTLPRCVASNSHPNLDAIETEHDNATFQWKNLKTLSLKHLPLSLT